jgi:CheY-like chemotaxis protein
MPQDRVFNVLVAEDQQF